PDSYRPVGTHLRIPFDHEDRYFTTRDGFRATVGFDPKGLAPGRRPRKLFVLGGSTTYCQEVPDEFTWASHLQKRLAAVPGTQDIEVVNCGFPSMVSLQEVERLEYEIGRNNIPDFCIFFDGINDMAAGVRGGAPGGLISELFRKHTDTALFATL